MNAESTIRELVDAYLSDNHNVNGIEFIDQILRLATKVGAIDCTLAGDRRLSFQIAGEPTWQVEVDRARAKLRMLCARLGVLCNECGDQDVSLYGGEGLIQREIPTDNLGRSSGSGVGCSTGTSVAPPPSSAQWKVRFKNTPSEHEFSIHAQ